MHTIFLLLIALFTFTTASEAAERVIRLSPPKQSGYVANSLRIFCYHDIRDNLASTLRASPDASAVDTKAFTEQLSWLYANGWVSVGLDELIASRNGGKTLPDKAFLLTFDDGYKSVYTHVYPLLQAFKFKAVIGLVGEWLDAPPDGAVTYSDKRWARKEFVAWSEVKEMTQSGLVEVASHSHSLHKGLIANPQGNLQPAATSRLLINSASNDKRYESDEAYRSRVTNDLIDNNLLLKTKLGSAPRAMIWPYGSYNAELLKIAANQSMPIAFSLAPGNNTPATPLNQLRREHILFNTSTGDFINLLRNSAAFMGNDPPLLRVMHIDLDYVYDANPVQQEKNLSALIDRVVALQPSTIFLQAFADPDGDGSANALYFPNRHLPMRADLFNRVAWQLSTRAGVRVFAWMPVSAYTLPKQHQAAHASTLSQTTGLPSKNWPYRLSIFDPAAKQTIREIYEDLGKSASFFGILFHDDAMLTDDEDASPFALQAYQTWGISGNFADIRKDPLKLRRWAQLKAAAINDFTLELAQTLRQYHPNLLTARNLFARPLLDPNSIDWFSQSYEQFLKDYDYTAVMAMPMMEKAANPDAWLAKLVDKAAAHPEGLRRTIFELQAKDWQTQTPIAAETLAHQFHLLRARGVRSMGYYPDDFLKNTPSIDKIRESFSLKSNPVNR